MPIRYFIAFNSKLFGFCLQWAFFPTLSSELAFWISWNYIFQDSQICWEFWEVIVSNNSRDSILGKMEMITFLLFPVFEIIPLENRKVAPYISSWHWPLSINPSSYHKNNQVRGKKTHKFNLHKCIIFSHKELYGSWQLIFNYKEVAQHSWRKAW